MRQLLSLFVLLCLLIPFSAQANYDEEENVRDMPFRERVFVGGGLGLQFGTSTYINISPILGYRITNRLSAGVGGTYQYYRERVMFFQQGESVYFTYNLYGYNVFSRYFIIPSLFAHAEFENLNMDAQMASDPLENVIKEGRMWEQNYFLGGGYRQALGYRTFINLMVLYNFNPQSVIHRQNPVLRLGVDVRL